MKEVDIKYKQLLEDIVKNGVEKDTRAGRVKSVFGRQLSFDISETFPILTTKKVPYKGVLRELLWFLQDGKDGTMNIRPLIEKGVEIWTPDAYRWFKEKISKNLKDDSKFIIIKDEDVNEDFKTKSDLMLMGIAKFRELALKGYKLKKLDRGMFELFNWEYEFGDLGAVYGTQWRSFGESGIDQIKDIIEKLKKNPDDRRMLCLAYNPEVLDSVALPPCHVMMQFYTRPLSIEERQKIAKKELSLKELDEKGIPSRGLSCMWTQRSVDVPLGLTWNIISYCCLTYMLAEIVNMVPDKLCGSLGDCHIYLNQMDGVQEHLSREGTDCNPQFRILRHVTDIDDFKFEDFELVGYEPQDPIKMPLSVG